MVVVGRELSANSPLGANGGANGNGANLGGVGLMPPQSGTTRDGFNPTGPDKGLMVPRRFTTPGVHPFDEITFVKKSSKITEPDGTIVFELPEIEVPDTWSQLATDILASKYCRRAGVPGTGKEVSSKQVVTRLARTIRNQGDNYGVFATREDADAFEMELTHMLITQKGAFNSPVWFNCGLYHEYGAQGSGGNFYTDQATGAVLETSNSYEHPQCSACFIQSVNDDLMDIFELIKNEARLFKFGSGTGTNFSRLRGRQEKLSGGGTSSGLMSFLEVLDRGAGATKSGGTTRRAAKMVSLDMDHPEIIDFIDWKMREEKKVKALIDAGYPADFNGEAYKTVSGQNSNNSVRINDQFMQSYLEDGDWHTTMRTTGETVETFKARDLMDKIAMAAWSCADPGVQFDDIINDWNTALNTDRIYGSNPCSEYHFLDNTACNLASINLVKFLDDQGRFDIEGFRHACRVFFIAQEILVDFASYPTPVIAKNSHDYRPLGLGYANLGTLLMINGIPYDSDASYAITGAITAIMCGHAYKTSAELAAVLDPFPAYAPNRSSMLRVMNKHREASYQIDEDHCPAELLQAAREDWDEAVLLGEKYGYRNAQSTVLAPTGTIGLLMDCDTTGIEPDFALVKWKKLAGGGYFKIVNQSINAALSKLGYTDRQIQDIQDTMLGRGTLKGAPFANEVTMRELGFDDATIHAWYEAVKQTGSFNEWTAHITPKLLRDKGMTTVEIQAIIDYVNGTQTVEGAPHIREEHLPVFDCANKCGNGKRFIAPMAHINIMAAAQPFLSGAISKTVNLPGDATVEDIKEIYVEAWKKGLKCVALYRDGSKFSQALNTATSSAEDDAAEADEAVAKIATESTAVSAVVAEPYQGLLWGDKRHLPQMRSGLTIDSNVGGHKVHLRTGEYEDGHLGRNLYRHV
jgi:ribonucleoside-diphosphate reductase alpha chain